MEGQDSVMNNDDGNIDAPGNNGSEDVQNEDESHLAVQRPSGNLSRLESAILHLTDEDRESEEIRTETPQPSSNLAMEAENATASGATEEQEGTLEDQKKTTTAPAILAGAAERRKAAVASPLPVTPRVASFGQTASPDASDDNQALVRARTGGSATTGSTSRPSIPGASMHYHHERRDQSEDSSNNKLAKKIAKLDEEKADSKRSNSIYQTLSASKRSHASPPRESQSVANASNMTANWQTPADRRESNGHFGTDASLANTSNATDGQQAASTVGNAQPNAADEMSYDTGRQSMTTARAVTRDDLVSEVREQIMNAAVTPVLVEGAEESNPAIHDAADSDEESNIEHGVNARRNKVEVQQNEGRPSQRLQMLLYVLIVCLVLGIGVVVGIVVGVQGIGGNDNNDGNSKTSQQKTADAIISEEFLASLTDDQFQFAAALSQKSSIIQKTDLEDPQTLQAQVMLLLCPDDAASPTSTAKVSCATSSDEEILQAFGIMMLYAQRDDGNAPNDLVAGTHNRALCDWPGVTCGVGNEVTELDLSSQRIDGEIPLELYHLSGLAKLSLQDNLLAGPLPAEFGEAWPLMEFFDVSNNKLTGFIPSEYGEWYNLASFSIQRNDIGPTYVPPEVCSKETSNGAFVAADCGGNMPQEVICPCCSWCCKDGEECAEQIPLGSPNGGPHGGGPPGGGPPGGGPPRGELPGGGPPRM
eukprot:CAMPEP_0119555374 /NCGR_PEP_ID=MMETSP1352-20130426/7615_1 /TAXON_ID=265584 /ORGANISM="Stauroneis constricta, Strain CCMP1120" /LENGTH=704 /DNA_ID=CAMNT_0007602127 /DNA_START=93 /DNA_END=2207 /DNA_ORIENTATION=+